ncbi:RES family NAD+ phosphorylase [Rugamonas apoptosis]|uniref:RES family NAD+ phosphorylase n=1 Tax=Rugamonas apoptosis TaxID=2758570 RepID=A0A7W2IMI3_9BURK|nr:RES family NAD+ phosphorylase [Rugamonas apoptosis]MBA5689659.1 RES family NAD+ phosphorylase [Rugamonas apoptosis]
MPVEASRYPASDLTGTGAKMTGGRWNSPGLPVVYCAINIALATLETVYCLRNGALPFYRFLVRIDIPDAVWAARTILNPPPGGWNVQQILRKWPNILSMTAPARYQAQVQRGTERRSIPASRTTFPSQLNYFVTKSMTWRFGKVKYVTSLLYVGISARRALNQA